MNTSSQIHYVSTRLDLLRRLPQGKICAEVGVLAGDFSKQIMEIMSPKELTLIDHFSGKLFSGDHNGENVKEYDLDQELINLTDYFSNDARVHLVKGLSYNVLDKYQDNYFDFIYIDSDHTYEGTKRELALCFQKVKHGGIISGHDYDEAHFPGCKRAVDEFCSEYKQSISLLTTDDRMSSFVIYLNKMNDTDARTLMKQIMQKGLSLLSDKRMENLKTQIDYVVTHNIPGCFIETGTAHGGSIIFMKKYLELLGKSREIYACDSFQGMSAPDIMDLDYLGNHANMTDHSSVAVSRQKFIENIKLFGISEGDIHIYEGWFEQTLPGFMEDIALLRMDSDFYDPTMTTLDCLYDRVVPGGVVIIDDYGWWQGCKEAVHDFFEKRSLSVPEFHVTDNTEVWFIKK